MKTPLAPALVISLAVVSASPGVARAQDMGIGWFMPWNNVPSPTNFINDWALQNAARGGRRPPSNNVYANNPNSYVNRVRDNGFVTQYDARGRSPGRRRPASSAASTSLGQPPTAAARPAAEAAPQPAAPSRPVPSLASFFDAAGRLVWPSDSPAGDLQAKRDVSDQAVSAVRKEVDAQGWAPIALAAEARQKLLDYGRPALQEIREESSPRIAEAFHGFLMALYDSLAAASIPPAPPVSR
ncbi:hypothetical protein [Paludisphaera soli]|uniref:hypothetical protein n=1 Tax=Paludisphaera soli TaxID=2712865 RepID=UPI0013EBA14C|nr:hypothetical protein [Paludisphaera soli]